MDAFIARAKLQYSFKSVDNIWQKADPARFKPVDNYVSKAQLFTLDQGALRTFMDQKNKSIRLVLPDGHNGTYEIDLSRFDIYAHGFKVRENAGGVLTDFNYTPGLVYRGIVNDIPGSLAAFSFFSALGMVGAKGSIILTHTALAVPVMLTTVMASLSNFDRTLVRAAASLGAGPLLVFFRVVLPLIAPGVVSGAIIAFIISFDEIVVASFLSTGEERTLPRMIFSGVRESISPAIASVAVLLVLFSAILLVAIGWLQSRASKSRVRASG